MMMMMMDVLYCVLLLLFCCFVVLLLTESCNATNYKLQTTYCMYFPSFCKKGVNELNLLPIVSSQLLTTYYSTRYSTTRKLFYLLLKSTVFQLWFSNTVSCTVILHSIISTKHNSLIQQHIAVVIQQWKNKYNILCLKPSMMAKKK